LTTFPARKLDAARLSSSIKAAAATLNELASQLAELILWLETERGQFPDEAVLRYVSDAVTLEIRHRRRARELARALAAIEREAAAPAVPASEWKPAAPRTAVASARAPALMLPGRTDAEDAFLQAAVENGAPVHLRCLDGYEVLSAVVRDVSAHAVLVETPDGRELFLKRSLISIVRS
jgi:hypothetical protein